MKLIAVDSRLDSVVELRINTGALSPTPSFSVNFLVQENLRRSLLQPVTNDRHRLRIQAGISKNGSAKPFTNEFRITPPGQI
jgi:hypothetical protein